ncbi:MAG: DUF1553 domain-containing protein [Pirellulaceae bacterium]|nr:DUF1553 domain-containing protein [Pirellulaceae bacterium]
MNTSSIKRRCIFIAVYLFAAYTVSTPLALNAAPVEFNKQIRPILTQHCLACHGPDAASRKADLRLDIESAALASGFIVAGDAKQSELINRINSSDNELIMPPAEHNKPLSAESKKLLTQWINEGARWEKHWAFIKPSRPTVPQIKNSTWAKNQIDHFILQKLSELSLTPNPAADAYTIARRVALDTTGLPPQTTAVTTLVKAENSDSAYESYIDELLASKHAGEHRARYWLDAARYGDTHGMHVDNYREIWPYRDWVIAAFNNNMPFDQFVIDQIAGDLRPQATMTQQIATGFSRCNITTSEGGAIPEEVGVRYMVDRVETTTTVFLGLTAGCAVCHDHKYDPISQREFYQLGAFFNNTTQPVMDGNQKDSPPVVTIAKEEFADEWNELLVKRQQLYQRLAQSTPTSKIRRWWPNRQSPTSTLVSAEDLLMYLPLSDNEKGSLLFERSDNSNKNNVENAIKTAIIPEQLPADATFAMDNPAGKRGIRFTTAGGFSTDFPAIRTDEPLTVSFWIRTPDKLLSSTIFDQTSQNEDKKTVGWKINASTQGQLIFELHDGTGKNIKCQLPGETPLAPRSWQHVCVRYSGGQSNSSITVLINGVQHMLRNSSEDLIDATDLPAAPLKIAGNLPTGSLADIRIYRRWVSNEECRIFPDEYKIADLIDSDSKWKDLTSDDRAKLTGFYDTSINPTYQNDLAKLWKSQTRRDYIYSRSTTTLVMQERPTPATAWVLSRGEYDQRLDEVAPGVPEVLQFGKYRTAFSNRMDLANWLVDPSHPLTARVMVNRLWQSIFGIGLVKTSEDFGVMGERPTHPELLDWLAVEFIESGWDVKHILKLMLTSATYRQSGQITGKHIEIDRGNRYHARGPRLRLDAEILRDQALSVSGLLKTEMGGPSVKPYQPAGLWKVVAITGSNTRYFNRDEGDALYRRSVYTFWKRTSPPPSMAAFNAPTREQCTVRRERTNTPIQALVMLNDPQFIEAARHLAQQSMQKYPDQQCRAMWMFTTVFKRPATPADVSDMESGFKEVHDLFKDDTKAAKELVKVGDTSPDETLDAAELAAWTIVANTLMNRDDFINK